MNDALVIDGWRLERAVDDDIGELMTWFDCKRSVDIWGSPKFRYPPDRASANARARTRSWRMNAIT